VEWAQDNSSFVLVILIHVADCFMLLGLPDNFLLLQPKISMLCMLLPIFLLSRYAIVGKLVGYYYQYQNFLRIST
jgi:hypothetical protein